MFRILHITKEQKEQGFADYSYDLVVASLVLHATPRMEQTMRNVRRLLKPGAYVLILELTSNDTVRPETLFGSFPGWWRGAEEGRVLSPCITLTEWDSLLRRTGFSGCDTTSPDPDPTVFPMSVFASQAADEQIKFLREPLTSSTELFKAGIILQHLVLLGGQTLLTSKLIDRLEPLLQQYCNSIKSLRSWTDVTHSEIPSCAAILSLIELDEPVFKRLTVEKLKACKNILQEANTVLWVTQGRRAENPYMNMTIGLIRSVIQEFASLRFQSLDIDSCHNIDPRTLAEALLRFKAATLW